MTDSVGQPLPAQLDAAYLPDSAAKSRFGAAYVRTVCSQAGVGFDETSVDEDFLAVDAKVEFPVAAARLQIKGTSQYRLDHTPIRWPIKPEWWHKWATSMVPVYFVLVVLDTPTRADWLMHPIDGTMCRAAAYWTRVNGINSSPSVGFERTKRLTVETIDVWCAEVQACFGGTSTGAGR